MLGYVFELKSRIELCDTVSNSGFSRFSVAMTLPITTTYVRRTMNFSAKIRCTRCQTQSSPMARSILGKKKMMFSSRHRRPRLHSLFRPPSASRLLNRPPSCHLLRFRPPNASQRRNRLRNCPRLRVSRLHKRLLRLRHRDWTRSLKHSFVAHRRPPPLTKRQWMLSSLTCFGWSLLERSVRSASPSKRTNRGSYAWALCLCHKRNLTSS